MWASVKQCNACNGRYIGKKRSCNFAKGNDKMILGEKFENVCGYLIFTNPDSEVLDLAIRCIDIKAKCNMNTRSK